MELKGIVIVINFFLMTLLLRVGEADGRRDLNYCNGERIENLHQLAILKDCDVIEGNLIIAFKISKSESEWATYGKLRVKEITGYLILFLVDQLPSLDFVLPNLRVIRGNTLFSNYALIVYGLMHLENIMLTNLTTILRGSVYIENNPVISYYTHTIDWDLITAWNATPNFIQPIEGPMQLCPEKCRIANSSSSFCWSADSCQKSCDGNQWFNHSFCNENLNSVMSCPYKCLGGCYRSGNETFCEACRHFRYFGRCSQSCFPYYELDNYRCIKADECTRLRNGKLLHLKGTSPRNLCVQECPALYTLSVRENVCRRCKGGECTKECAGGLINNIETAQRFTRCTKITSSLEISINGRKLMPELVKHLGNIREVVGFVRIFKSRGIVALDFLANLSKIHGKELWNNFSLIVHDNDDLEDLWNISSFPTLQIRKGRVMFFSNPKLCPQRIESLVGKNSWLTSVPDHRFLLNGNKRACNVDQLFNYSVYSLPQKGKAKVTFHKDEIKHQIRKDKLIGFYIYYQKTYTQDLKYSDSNRQWSQIFKKYINDANEKFEVVIQNLEPASKYGVYLEAHYTDSEENFQSSIKYVFINPFNPGVPEDIFITRSEENHIELSWLPPQQTHGEIDHYLLTFEPIHYKAMNSKSSFDICDERIRRDFLGMISKQKKYKNLFENFGKNFKNEPKRKDYGSNIRNLQTCTNEEHHRLKSVEEIKLGKLNLAENLSRLLYIIEPPYSIKKRNRMDLSYRDLLHTKTKRDISHRKDLEENCQDSSHSRPQKQRSKALRIGRDLKLSFKDDKQLTSISYSISASTENTEYFNTMKLMLIEYSKILSLDSLIPYLEKPDISRKCISYMMNFVDQLLAQEDYKPLLMNHSIQNCLKIFSKSYEPQFCSHNGSFNERMIYGTKVNLTRLDHLAYKVNIKACHKAVDSAQYCRSTSKFHCKLCSLWPRSKIIYNVDEEGAPTLKIAVNSIVENHVQVLFNFSSGKEYDSRYLGYDMYVRKIDDIKKNETMLETRFCRNALKNDSTWFDVASKGNYLLEVSPFSALIGSLRRTSPIYFTIKDFPQVDNSRSVKFLVPCLTFLLVMFVIGIFILVKILKEKRAEKVFEQIESVINKEYEASRRYADDCLPLWRNYLERKINHQFIHARKDLSILGLMDEGKFGVVSRGTLMVASGIISVAIKKIKPSNFNDLSHQCFLIDEAALMLELQSHHLVRSFGVVSSNSELYLVMELMHHGSLSKYLKANKKGDNIFNIFTEQQVVKLGVQIADGMAYLHYKKILHMDLAARNCLLDGNLNVKVSDFGMSRIVEGEYYTFRANKPVPFRWMPPENFNEEKFTTLSDVWSYGILLWEVVNPGKLPYQNLNGIEDVKNKVSSGYTLSADIPASVPPHLAALIIACWQFRPNDRPNFRKIITGLLPYTDDNFKEEFKVKSFYYGRKIEDSPHYFSVSTTYGKLHNIINGEKITSSTPLTGSLAHSKSLSKLKTSYSCLSYDESNFRSRITVPKWHSVFASLRGIPMTFGSTFKPTNFRENIVKSENIQMPSPKHKNSVNTEEIYSSAHSCEFNNEL